MPQGKPQPAKQLSRRTRNEPMCVYRLGNIAIYKEDGILVCRWYLPAYVFTLFEERHVLSVFGIHTSFGIRISLYLHVFLLYLRNKSVFGI